MDSKKSSGSSSAWTWKQNKLFETALAIFDLDKPDCWANIAKHVGGGKTVADVKAHYEKLVDDVKSIDEGKIPLPKYKN